FRCEQVLPAIFPQVTPPARAVTDRRICNAIRIGESGIAVALYKAADTLQNLPPFVVAAPAQGSPGIKARCRRLYGLAFRPSGDAVVSGQFTSQGKQGKPARRALVLPLFAIRRKYR